MLYFNLIISDNECNKKFEYFSEEFKTFSGAIKKAKKYCKEIKMDFERMLEFIEIHVFHNHKLIDKIKLGDLYCDFLALPKKKMQ